MRDQNGDDWEVVCCEEVVVLHKEAMGLQLGEDEVACHQQRHQKAPRPAPCHRTLSTGQNRLADSLKVARVKMVGVAAVSRGQKKHEGQTEYATF